MKTKKRNEQKSSSLQLQQKAVQRLKPPIQEEYNLELDSCELKGSNMDYIVYHNSYSERNYSKNPLQTPTANSPSQHSPVLSLLSSPISKVNILSKKSVNSSLANSQAKKYQSQQILPNIRHLSNEQAEKSSFQQEKTRKEVVSFRDKISRNSFISRNSQYDSKKYQSLIEQQLYESQRSSQSTFHKFYSGQLNNDFEVNTGTNTAAGASGANAANKGNSLGELISIQIQQSQEQQQQQSEQGQQYLTEFAATSAPSQQGYQQQDQLQRKSEQFALQKNQQFEQQSAKQNKKRQQQKEFASFDERYYPLSHSSAGNHNNSGDIFLQQQNLQSLQNLQKYKKLDPLLSASARGDQQQQLDFNQYCQLKLQSKQINGFDGLNVAATGNSSQKNNKKTNSILTLKASQTPNSIKSSKNFQHKGANAPHYTLSAGQDDNTSSSINNNILEQIPYLQKKMVNTIYLQKQAKKVFEKNSHSKISQLLDLPYYKYKKDRNFYQDSSSKQLINPNTLTAAEISQFSLKGSQPLQQSMNSPSSPPSSSSDQNQKQQQQSMSLSQPLDTNQNNSKSISYYNANKISSNNQNINNNNVNNINPFSDSQFSSAQFQNAANKTTQLQNDPEKKQQQLSYQQFKVQIQSPHFENSSQQFQPDSATKTFSKNHRVNNGYFKEDFNSLADITKSLSSQNESLSAYQNPFSLHQAIITSQEKQQNPKQYQFNSLQQQTVSTQNNLESSLITPTNNFTTNGNHIYSAVNSNKLNQSHNINPNSSSSCAPTIQRRSSEDIQGQQSITSNKIPKSMMSPISISNSPETNTNHTLNLIASPQNDVNLGDNRVKQSIQSIHNILTNAVTPKRKMVPHESQQLMSSFNNNNTNCTNNINSEINNTNLIQLNIDREQRENTTKSTVNMPKSQQNSINNNSVNITPNNSANAPQKANGSNYNQNKWKLNLKQNQIYKQQFKQMSENRKKPASISTNPPRAIDYLNKNFVPGQGSVDEDDLNEEDSSTSSNSLGEQIKDNEKNSPEKQKIEETPEKQQNLNNKKEIGQNPSLIQAFSQNSPAPKDSSKLDDSKLMIRDKKNPLQNQAEGGSAIKELMDDPLFKDYSNADFSRSQKKRQSYNYSLQKQTILLSLGSQKFIKEQQSQIDSPANILSQGNSTGTALQQQQSLQSRSLRKISTSSMNFIPFDSQNLISQQQIQDGNASEGNSTINNSLCNQVLKKQSTIKLYQTSGIDDLPIRNIQSERKIQIQQQREQQLEQIQSARKIRGKRYSLKSTPDAQNLINQNYKLEVVMSQIQENDDEMNSPAPLFQPDRKKQAPGSLFIPQLKIVENQNPSANQTPTITDLNMNSPSNKKTMIEKHLTKFINRIRGDLTTFIMTKLRITEVREEVNSYVNLCITLLEHATAQIVSSVNKNKYFMFSEQNLIDVGEFVRDKFLEHNFDLQQVIFFHKKYNFLVSQIFRKNMLEQIESVMPLSQLIDEVLNKISERHLFFKSFDNNDLDNVRNAIMGMVSDNKDILLYYLDMYKHTISIQPLDFFILKLTIYETLSKKNFDQEVVFNIIEKFEKTRNYLFPHYQFSDANFRKNISSLFYYNKVIGGYFMDPSMQTMTDFIHALWNCLHGFNQMEKFAEQLKNFLKIEPNEKFIDVLHEIVLEYVQKTLSDDQKDDLTFKFFKLKQILNSHQLIPTLCSSINSSQVMETFKEINLLKAINKQVPVGLQEMKIFSYKNLQMFLDFAVKTNKEVFSIFESKLIPFQMETDINTVNYQFEILKQALHTLNIEQKFIDQITYLYNLLFIKQLTK